MDTQELKNIWQDYDHKLERSWKLNIHCLEQIQSQKVRSKLRFLLISRLIEIMVHIIMIGWLCSFAYTHFIEWQYVIAAMVLILFFSIAFSNCVRQIVIIKEIDYSKSITDIQKKLTLLQSHLINYVRLSFLVLPTYLAYPIIGFKILGNFDIISKLSHNWWLAQIGFTILMVPVSIWLYREVSFRNLHKKWVRNIIESSSGNAVSKAMDFLKEIEDFKKE